MYLYAIDPYEEKYQILIKKMGRYWNKAFK